MIPLDEDALDLILSLIRVRCWETTGSNDAGPGVGAPPPAFVRPLFVSHADCVFFPFSPHKSLGLDFNNPDGAYFIPLSRSRNFLFFFSPDL